MELYILSIYIVNKFTDGFYHILYMRIFYLKYEIIFVSKQGIAIKIMTTRFQK